MKEGIKKGLWEMWGKPEYPAEWDGSNFGGGKCSQRYWEYLFVINNFPDNLDKYSVILDIGSGENKFFPTLIRKHCRCIAVDPDLIPTNKDDINRVFDSEIVSSISKGKIDVVTCISVLEHIEDQVEFMTTLDLINTPAIITFEFGSTPPAFDYQLTAMKMYSFCRAIKNHYVSRMERSPVLADNSNGHWYPVGLVLLPSQFLSI